MSILDKVVAAVVPEPTAEERAECRRKARALSGGSGWLAQVLDHHEQVDAAFQAVRDAADAASRRTAQRRLTTLLTGHSLAEEAVLYPAMAITGHKAHSSEAFVEQSGAKVQVAWLDELEPMSKDYLDKLDHLQSAVTMHVHREESDWFPELHRTGDANASRRDDDHPRPRQQPADGRRRARSRAGADVGRPVHRHLLRAGRRSVRR